MKTHANPSCQLQKFQLDLTAGRRFLSQSHPAPASGGGMLHGLRVRLGLCSVSPSILTTCSTPRASRAGQPRSGGAAG
jgi:hypothetical protein